MGCNQTRTFSTDMDLSDNPVSEEDLVKPSVICMAHSPKALVVCLHPNKPLLGVGLEDGRILAINFETGDLDVNEYVAEDPVRALNFIARDDLDVLLYGSDDSFVGVFDLSQKKNLFEFKAHTDAIRFIEVHPHLNFFLTSSDDETVRLWSWPDWRPKRTFSSHNDYVMCVRFCPKDFTKPDYQDRQRFATASTDGTLKLWRINGTLERTFGKASKGYNSLVFHSDPQRMHLMAGSDDGSVSIYDYKRGTCLLTVVHTDSVNCVGFHPNLPYGFSSSEDGLMRIYSDTDLSLICELPYQGASFAYDTRPVLGIATDTGALLLSFLSYNNKKMVIDVESQQKTEFNKEIEKRPHQIDDFNWLPGQQEIMIDDIEAGEVWSEPSSQQLEGKKREPEHRGERFGIPPGISEDEIAVADAALDYIDEDDEPEELSEYKFEEGMREGGGMLEDGEEGKVSRLRQRSIEFNPLVSKLEKLVLSGDLTQEEFEQAREKLLQE